MQSRSDPSGGADLHQRSDRELRERVPIGWWVLVASFMVSCTWLATRTRVFIDQVWITEYGRRLLDVSSHSMYMNADGSSQPAASWLGSLLAELSFRAADGLLGFRILATLAAVIMAWSLLKLAMRLGVPSRLALPISIALLFDASVVQSVVLGRADTLALAMFFGGLLLARKGVEDLTRAPSAWRNIALGYSLCALSPAAWASIVLLGPVALAEWIHLQRQVRRSQPGSWPPNLAFIVIPSLVFILAVVLPYANSFGSAYATTQSWFFQTPELRVFLSFVFQQVSTSICLVVAGLFALSQLRPRATALILAIGVVGVLFSGFYPFRVPYLIAYFVIAALLYAAHLAAYRRNQELVSWNLLAKVSAAIAIGLMGLRILLAFGNQPAPTAPPWFTNLSSQSTIADYSWDFYETARRQARPVMRSFPGMPNDGVESWLKLTRPSHLIRAIDPRNSWIMVDDLNAVLTASNYCQIGWIDWAGEPVSASARAPEPPTPTLWRLGMFRAYGPYALWRPCESSGQARH